MPHRKRDPRQTGPAKAAGSRIRWQLLILLWIWAALVFVLLDLFLDLRGLDPIRPRATIYEGMRRAAHELIGEAYREEISPQVQPARPPPRLTSGRETVDRELPDAHALTRMLGRATRISDDPEALSAYGEEASELAARLCLELGPRATLRGGVRLLMSEVVEAQARNLERLGAEAGASAWRSARASIERLDWAAPGFHRMAVFSDGIEQLRYAVASRLEGLEAEGTRPDAADLEAIRLAAIVGSGRSVETCLRLLELHGTSPVTRRMTLDESRFREHAIRTIREQGGRQHHRALAEWLCRESEHMRDSAGSSR